MPTATVEVKPDTYAERIIYDLRAVAELVSLSYAEVRREVQRGTLPHVRRGRRILCTRAQLLEYAARLERGSAA